MKIIFPEPGQDVVPAFSPDGPRPATMRTYTPRRFDAALQTLEVDFVLHGEGPASTWAARAQAGQELVMMGPAPGYIVDAEASWYVLAGDDAALPAIETLLEAVPATARVSVFLEIAGDEEIRTLPGPERTEITWLRHDADPHRAGVRLQTALSEFAWPAGGGRVYVGCEAQAMRRIRRIVVEASGLDRERIVTRGYWRIGAVNHPDHDYALD